MSTLFAVAGVALTSQLIEQIMGYLGHGDKVVFVKIAAYIAAGYIAWDVWWDGIHMIAREFGVYGV